MPQKTSVPLLVYVTVAKRREAKNIARSLLEKKLVACVNITHSLSCFRWKKKCIRVSEYVLFMKSDKRHMPALVKEVKAMSSYDVPCILELPISGGSKEYLAWAERELRA